MPESTVASAPTIRLVEGEHLDQPTFHDLYTAVPPGTRADLINGAVSMPSSVGYEHSTSHGFVMFWLICYSGQTKGTGVNDNATAILGWRSEFQPDAMLRINPDRGGQTSIERGFIHGPPELVVEVADSSRYIDLGPKLSEYEKAGVLEYVVRAFNPDKVLWFCRENGSLVRSVPDSNGLYRSKTFPGLWLDPVALLTSDTARLRAVVDLGVATPEHAAFIARLAEAKAAH